MFGQVGVLLQGEGGVDLSCSPVRLLSADPVVKSALGSTAEAYAIRD